MTTPTVGSVLCLPKLEHGMWVLTLLFARITQIEVWTHDTLEARAMDGHDTTGIALDVLVYCLPSSCTQLQQGM
jgi:hypothetical protein